MHEPQHRARGGGTVLGWHAWVRQMLEEGACGAREGGVPPQAGEQEGQARATHVAEPRCSGAKMKGGMEGAREDVSSQVPVFFYTAEGADEEAVHKGGDVQGGVQWGGELGGRAERDGHVREVRAEGEGDDTFNNNYKY